MNDDVVGAREPRPEGDGSAGWYADPVDPSRVRAWDGAMWTDRTATPLVDVTAFEQRYAWATLWWGGLGIVCSVLPLASWLAVFLCGPFAYMSWRRNQRAARESGKPPLAAARLGVILGVIGMVIGIVAIPIYWMLWGSIFPTA
ncbi:MAG: DUF2510 domain-containing protein [Candidatus Nanopelagicales bacterium]